jgi:penicillin-binding protein-related factor A (putative recombinase)
MKESAFSKKFRDDVDFLYGDNAMNVLLVDAPRSNKKVCDDITIYNGKAYAIEFKVTNGNSFNFKKLQENQKISLKKLDKSGAKSYLIILFCKWKRIVAVRINTWLKIEKFTNKKSIKLKDLEDMRNVIIVDRKKINGKTRYEIERIIT